MFVAIEKKLFIVILKKKLPEKTKINLLEFR